MNSALRDAHQRPDAGDDGNTAVLDATEKVFQQRNDHRNETD